MEYSDKQEHILEIAERLFASNGFAGTSVRDIAKEAEVNLAMISYYFGSKEKLLAAIFINRAQNSRLQIEEIANNKNLDALGKVYKLIESYIARILSNPNFHKLMAREQLGTRMDEIHYLIKDTKTINQNLVRQIIEDGQKDGSFVKNVDVPLLMTTMFGTCNQLVTTQHYYKEINNMKDVPEEVFQRHLKKKLTTHLKRIFKAILTNEE